MKHYIRMRNTKGMALVMVLVIVTFSAGLLAVIMYFALSGAEVSGLQRRYQSSKEASLGAMDIMTKEIIPRVLQQNMVGGTPQGLGSVLGSFSSIFSQTPATPGATDPCFLTKLRNPTASWGTCTESDHSQRMDPTVSPDITFNLLSASSGSTRPFVVRVKIVDTSMGNTDLSGLILEGGGVAGQGGGTIAVKHFPYLYTIESDGRLQNSTTEKANLEFLYAY